MRHIHRKSMNASQSIHGPTMFAVYAIEEGWYRSGGYCLSSGLAVIRGTLCPGWKTTIILAGS